MRWHKDICPQKSYIFTKLQPTTLKKGCKSHHHVYTVTRHSRLKLAEELDDILILNKEVGFYNRGYVYIPDTDRYIDFATPFIMGESF